MNEAEAKTKWCPMVRVLAETNRGVAGANRGRESLPNTCIASRCMMWIPEKTYPSPYEGGNIMVTEGGRCGLAK